VSEPALDLGSDDLEQAITLLTAAKLVFNQADWCRWSLAEDAAGRGTRPATAEDVTAFSAVGALLRCEAVVFKNPLRYEHDVHHQAPERLRLAIRALAAAMLEGAWANPDVDSESRQRAEWLYREGEWSGDLCSFVGAIGIIEEDRGFFWLDLAEALERAIESLGAKRSGVARIER
jgi:hypothetical protein